VFLTSSFAILLQELAVAMTAPSFANFMSLATGWVFARRRTVTGMILAAGMAQYYPHFLLIAAAPRRRRCNLLKPRQRVIQPGSPSCLRPR